MLAVPALLSPILALGSARSLAGLGAALAAIPARALLPGHCLTVVSWYSDAALASNFMASYWVGLLAAFGGGAVTALLLQDPEAAPIALLADNAVGLTYTAAWWGLLYAPPLVRAPLAALVRFPLTRAAARACTNALRAGLVVARVNLAVRKFPGVVAAPLLLGTLAGCAGKILTDAALLGPASAATRGGRGPALRTEFAFPGLALRSAAGGAALYWLLAHVLRAVTPQEGLALVTLLFVGHGLAADAHAVSGAPPRPLDYTAAPAAALHWVAGVPMPGGGGVGGGGARPRASGRAKKAA